MATGPSEGFLSSYFRNPFKKKKGEDINLPMPPGGKRDPRLPKPKPKSTMEKVRHGFDVMKSLGRKKEKE
jgi:hypothetical protein